MKKPIFALLLALMLLLAACAAPEQAPETSPAPVPESPSSVTEPAPESEPEPASEPEPVPEPEPEPESSQPEEPASASSTPQQNPDISRRNPDTTFPPDQQPPVTTPVDPQAAMCDYLEANLTDEEYTSIYWRDEGLGVLTPNVERVKEVAAAYDGPAVDMEYCEVIHSKARLDAARKAYQELIMRLKDTDDPLIANSGTYGSKDRPAPGMIYITIHQMHPALREFLDTSGYGDCFVVDVTGADSPIVNPDT